MIKPFTYKSLKAHHKKELLQSKKTKLVINVSIIGLPDCENCSSGFPLVSLEEEISNQRLPFKDCPRVAAGRYKVCAAVYGCRVVRGGPYNLPLRVDENDF